MARGAQRAINGMAVDHQKGRFSGTFDLEEFEVDASGLDEVAVCVVVARIQGASPKITKKGELEQVTLYGVQEMRVVDDDLREALVERLNLLAGETLSFKFDEIEPKADVVTGELPPAPVTEIPPEPVAPDDGEPEPAHVDPPETPDGEVIGSVYGDRHGKDPDLARFMEGPVHQATR